MAVPALAPAHGSEDRRIPAPRVSVIVCTRNRGDSAVLTLETILANTHPQFELILVDQSSSSETSDAVARFSADPRFRYLPSETSGASRARNEGSAIATGAIHLFTDDDCSVPPNWIAQMEAVFERHQQVGVVFCNVDAAEHDVAKGFIPDYVRKDSIMVRTMREKCTARGIGAGIAMRRTVAELLGGFDQELGPGARFPGCEDRDLALRAILKGWWVFETHEVSVIHYGFRTWEEGKDLTKRDWVGIGAACAKPIKCGYWRAGIIAAYEVGVALQKPVMHIVRLRQPQGFQQIRYFARGFWRGLRAPVDATRVLFVSR